MTPIVFWWWIVPTLIATAIGGLILWCVLACDRWCLWRTRRGMRR